MKISNVILVQGQQLTNKLVNETSSGTIFFEKDHNHLKPPLLPHQILHYLRAPQFIPNPENFNLSKPSYEDYIARRHSVREFTPLSIENEHSPVMRYLSLLTNDPMMKRSMSLLGDFQKTDEMKSLQKPHMPQLVARPYSPYRPQIQKRAIGKKQNINNAKDNKKIKTKRNMKKEINVNAESRRMRNENKAKIRNPSFNRLARVKEEMINFKPTIQKNHEINLRIQKRSNSQPQISRIGWEKLKIHL
ncbi:unnamed protein product [Blepharisma stoltei]|uniref:Uncharacterized protein n=1 Tax=Blepharisma stoltei TaxID=1481888 RepID=A0AAU9IIK9_9CILI|nr:unnamed protein product [Blepharisma stoltei]